jgi:putative transposase
MSGSAGRSSSMRLSSCPTICTRSGHCRRDADFPGRWRAIKAGFTRAVTRHGVPLVRDRRGEYDLWQRRYWEHLIRDDEDFARHVDYIHHNPVKHGLATDPFRWRRSSIHAYARQGVINREWRGRKVGGRLGD